MVINNTAGSGTGTAAVQISDGTLAGSGTIAGAVTIGTGAFLAPAAGTKKQATLTIQSALTFQSDATYTYTFKAKKNKARTDSVVADGVTIKSGANFTLAAPRKGSCARAPSSSSSAIPALVLSPAPFVISLMGQS